jgi:ribosomal protein S18 acetylase RimI-like enzyme
MTTSLTLPDVRIRRELRPGDLGYIAHLHGQLYARECGYGLHFEGYVLAGLQEFAEQYDPAKDAVWVCEHDGKMVGFLLGFHRADTLQLRYFIFEPEYRGLGLGKKLMREFLAFMHEKQYRRAYLWTTREQTAAIALYTRFGFQLTEEKNSVAFDKELVEQRYDLLLAV